LTRARAEEFRRKAQECFDLARKISLERDRVVVLDIAQSWLRLAEQQETQEKITPPPAVGQLRRLPSSNSRPSLRTRTRRNRAPELGPRPSSVEFTKIESADLARPAVSVRDRVRQYGQSQSRAWPASLQGVIVAINEIEVC
jgi:hypothetical protein